MAVSCRARQAPAPARPGRVGAATLTRMDGRTVIDGLGRAAGLLGAARRIVVFSGAGISTDSKIIV
jgi:hypothetical protein